MIIIFSGLPRNLKKNLASISNIIKKYNARAIFSTNDEISDFKLPIGSKVIINENNEWYQNKFKEVCNYPKSESINMLQWLRFSEAIRYINENKMASENTIILKLRTDISNLDEIQIPNKISNTNFYMYSDQAFASTFSVMQKLDKIFFSNPENYIDLKLTIDVENKYFLNSEKRAARFEWLSYPRMISTFLPGRIFKYIVKTNFEKLLWVGPKNYKKQICFRYYKDIRRFQSEPAFLWSILKAELYVKTISTGPVKLDLDRK